MIGADAAATVRVTVAAVVLFDLSRPVVEVESVTRTPKEKLPVELAVPEMVPATRQTKPCGEVFHCSCSRCRAMWPPQ